jgi:hypothetical protein
MHVAGADRTDQNDFASPPQSEDDKDTAAVVGLANADEPLFIDRMLGVWKDCQGPLEQALDRASGEAVLLAFVAIACVPIESKGADFHGRSV